MFILFGFLVGITAFAAFVAGLLAFIRNNKSPQNRWFFVVTIFITIWICANFIDSNVVQPHWTDLFIKLDFISALFIAWSLLEFSDVFLTSKELSKRNVLIPNGFRYPTLIINLIFAALILTNLLVSSSIKSNSLHLNYHFLFLPYILLLIGYFIFAFIKLIYKRSHRINTDKQAVNMIFYGVLIALITNLLTNLVFPAIVTNRSIVQGLNVVGYVGLLVFVSSIYLAITRQKLFDIRLVVARSLAYLISLIVLAGAYGLIIFSIAQFVFNLHFSIGVQIFFSAATGIMGLAFQPFRQTFDKTTSRIFYQDAYDPQKLFDSLNKVLVSSLDIKFLMTQSVSVIETALKPDFALIGLKDGATGQRIFGSRKIDFTQETIQHVRRLTPHIHHKVIAADYLEGTEYAGLKDIMQTNNIAILVRLAQDVRKNEEGLGYIVLGPRKSGNPYSQRDIQVLDTVANELIIAIQNALHYEEIQRFNVTLQGRVEDATRKLRRTNERLKALDETKDDFISMASHQLRTPLTSVKGYLSMVIEGDAGKISPTQRKMLNQAFVSSQRMVYLIADLLNVSRLRTGKFIIETAPTNLSTMIEEELAQLTETAQARDITLTYNPPKDFPELMLDETKTRQVIMNFVDNAIYYTPEGGHINVQLTETPHSLELRVVDDGIGVPKAEQHHLFTKFYRAPNAQKARPDGTGLGLFMAKKVVLVQGGSIIFDSKENQGSTFGFSFPKSRLATIQPAKPTVPLVKLAVPKQPAKVR